MGRGVNRSHYFAGWHPTATVGCIGTAGACARLMGLSREATLHAMSLCDEHGGRQQGAIRDAGQVGSMRAGSATRRDGCPARRRRGAG
ncbi:MmgE/PrpD family protein [Bradyrhizobium sp. 13971]